MRIAIADDDAVTRAFLCELLAREGFRFAEFSNGRELLTALQRDTFDLLLLDLNMPKMDGLEVLGAAKSDLPHCPPVIILTNRADKGDIVRGLEAGADDYIVKPESADIILARIRAVTRRHGKAPEPSRLEQIGPYGFDYLENVVTFGGRQVTLTAKEMALARLFFQNAHRALSRAYILETIWNSVADLPTRTLDMHVSRIRSKLNLRPGNGYRLLTIFGYGYRLDTFESSE